MGLSHVALAYTSFKSQGFHCTCKSGLLLFSIFFPLSFQLLSLYFNMLSILSAFLFFSIFFPIFSFLFFLFFPIFFPLFSFFFLSFVFFLLFSFYCFLFSFHYHLNFYLFFALTCFPFFLFFFFFLLTDSFIYLQTYQNLRAIIILPFSRQLNSFHHFTAKFTSPSISFRSSQTHKLCPLSKMFPPLCTVTPPHSSAPHHSDPTRNPQLLPSPPPLTLHLLPSLPSLTLHLSRHSLNSAPFSSCDLEHDGDCSMCSKILSHLDFYSC